MTVAQASLAASYSNNQINAAGAVIRRFMNGEPADNDDLERALLCLTAFRSAHSYALTKANMGLRSMVRTEVGVRPLVTQRLKQWQTIVHKLSRQPDMKLARMQDVGGCRAIVPTIFDVYTVLRRIERNRPGTRLLTT